MESNAALEFFNHMLLRSRVCVFFAFRFQTEKTVLYVSASVCACANHFCNLKIGKFSVIRSIMLFLNEKRTVCMHAVVRMHVLNTQCGCVCAILNI